MRKTITCECGFVIEGATDDELVRRGQEHASQHHGLQLSREQLLAMATPAD
ncbi:MAG TPA: DUF1059 domain-containing protein [Candidatus Binatia bacterium]|nr:DUF1059 domain-containing protein [Candidatus Binatia bacterium]